MKLMISSLLLLTSMSAGAANVVVDSFSFTDRDPQRYNTTAELCGHVVGSNGTEKVLITVDPGNRQGEYVATVSPSGRFCHVVDTKSGRAQCSLIVNNVASGSVSATAK